MKCLITTALYVPLRTMRCILTVSGGTDWHSFSGMTHTSDILMVWWSAMTLPVMSHCQETILKLQTFFHDIKVATRHNVNTLKLWWYSDFISSIYELWEPKIIWFVQRIYSVDLTHFLILGYPQIKIYFGCSILMWSLTI